MLRAASSRTQHNLASSLLRRMSALLKAAAVGTALVGQKRAMPATIGTHSGTFHCDEALGCWLLQHTQQFTNSEIVRTRDPEVLKDLDVVIDVGGTYEPDKQRFDHHQRGFDQAFGHGYTTKLSSAGLVYKHYGKEVIAHILALPVEHPDVETVYLQVYKHFIEAVDAIDNGIHQWETSEPPKYLLNTHLGARVANLNPKWSEPQTEEALNNQFLKAVALTGSEFQESVEYLGKYWLPARTFVKSALDERHSIHPSGSIMVLRQVCPWKEHLYDLEKELGVSAPGVLYCLFQDDRDHSWRIQAVSVGPGSFDNRRSLPAAWRGLRDAALSEVTGVPGCVFVHAGGFIGGASTYEAVLELAVKALTLD